MALNVACIGIVFLLMYQTLTARRPALVAALIFGVGVTWLGQQGDVPYLGVLHPSSISWQAQLATYTSALIVNQILPVGTTTRTSTASTTIRVPATLSCLGAILMLYRFAVYGVPIIQGNAVRLDSIENLSPTLALTTSLLIFVPPLVLLKRRSLSPKLAYTVAAINFALLLATGSRLVVAGYILCALSAVATSASVTTLAKQRGRRGRLLLGLVTIGVILPIIYATRSTEDQGTAVLTQRVTQDSSLNQTLIATVGAGTYISARNGAMVSTYVLATSSGPRGGYAKSQMLNLANTFHLGPPGEDPELYLTETVFGLDRTAVGSTALPLPTALFADYSFFGSILLGAFYVFGYAGTRRITASASSTWWAFGVALSAYGMYLLSQQFATIMVGFIVADLVTRRTVSATRQLSMKVSHVAVTG